MKVAADKRSLSFEVPTLSATSCSYQPPKTARQHTPCKDAMGDDIEEAVAELHIALDAMTADEIKAQYAAKAAARTAAP